jgi:hypothetical protein
VLASLTVLIPPSITAQPGDQTTTVGSNVTFLASASGSLPLTYQWWFGGGALSGQTANSLVLTNVQLNQAGPYQIVASNAAGSATSAVARLTVQVPPGIISQPTNQFVALGSNAVFQVSASGSAPLSYQWWFNATNSVGGDTNVLSLLNLQLGQAGNYCVVVTNAAGAVTSVVATLTVGISAAVTQNPSSLVIAQGQVAGFTVGASGTAPLNYQWRFNGTALNSATASSLNIGSVTLAQAGNYDVVVGNSYGSATSLVAQLTVLVPPSISTQPTNQSVATGGNASFQATATGTSPLAYQWWFNQTNAVGGDTNVLTISNAQVNQAGNYTVVITNVAGAITSIVAGLTVGIPPAVTQNPVSLVIAQGQDANFAVVVSGDAPVQYQWRVNGTALAGATTSSYTIAGVDPSQAGGYDVLVNNSFGALTSAVAQLTVIVPPTMTSQPISQTVVAGSGVTFQAAVSGSQPVQYQWWFNVTNAVGGSTNVLALANAQPDMAGAYTLVATNLAGATTSAVAQLTVIVPPAILTQPTNSTILAGGTADFVASATGSGPLIYQWSFNGTVLAGARTNELRLTNVQASQAGSYVLLVTNLSGSATSAAAQLKVLVAPSASAPVLTSSGVSISVETVLGLNYLLEYKNELQDPGWTAATTWLPGTGGIVVLQDTNSTSSSRFYRIRGQ